MIAIKKLFVCLFLLFSSVTSSVFPVAAQNRIVSLKPNITEILFDLGLGDKIVGATRYCNWPKAAKKTPRVADYLNIHLEKVIALKPDLIISSKENSSAHEIKRLEKMGFKILLLNFNNSEAILQSILILGQELKAESEAQKMKSTIAKKLRSLKEKNQGKSKIKVAFIVGTQPLIAAGSKNFFNESSQYLNLSNVFSEHALAFPRINYETLISKRPDVIFDFSMGSEGGSEGNTEFSLSQKNHRILRLIPAFQKNQVYRLPVTLLRASKQLVTGYEKLGQILQSIESKTPATL